MPTGVYGRNPKKLWRCGHRRTRENTGAVSRHKLRGVCRECLLARQRENRLKNAEKINATARRRLAERIAQDAAWAALRRRKQVRLVLRKAAENRAWLNAYKLDRGCIDCGSLHHLEFDHVRGVKLFNIGQSAGRSRAVLLAEMSKCEVRCKPCHLRRPDQGRRRKAA